MTLNTYTFGNLQDACKHATGITTPRTGSSWAIVVNNALTDLCESHQWSWLITPMSLDFTLTAIATSMARSSNVVTVTSAAHGLAVGDTVRIVSSVATTDSFNGVFIVATVAASNVFTFAQSGASESATTLGSFIPGHVVLPADFSRLQTIHRRLVYSRMIPASFEDLLYFRSTGGAPTIDGNSFLYAIRGAKQASTGDASLQRLELFPVPSATEVSAISGAYFRQPPVLANSSHLPDIPARFAPLLFQMCRAAAIDETGQSQGRDHEKALALMEKMKMSDGQVQTDIGPITGGWMTEAYNLDDSRFYPESITN